MAFLVQLNTTRASNTNRLEEVSVLGFRKGRSATKKLLWCNWTKTRKRNLRGSRNAPLSTAKLLLKYILKSYLRPQTEQLLFWQFKTLQHLFLFSPLTWTLDVVGSDLDFGAQPRSLLSALGLWPPPGSSPSAILSGQQQRWVLLYREDFQTYPSLDCKHYALPEKGFKV